MGLLERTPPTVMYDIKVIQRPLPGRPYLGFVCGACGAHLAMLNDNGAKTAPSLPPSDIEVRCIACGTTGHYATGDLVPFVA